MGGRTGSVPVEIGEQGVALGVDGDEARQRLRRRSDDGPQRATVEDKGVTAGKVGSRRWRRRDPVERVGDAVEEVDHHASIPSPSR